jgi:hypothetical protein
MFEDKSWYQQLPPETSPVCEENLEEFFSTMWERQQIWYNRFILKAPAPWTTDPILRDYKFTNVYRELDNSSQYLINNAFLHEKDEQQVLFSILVHRIYNKAETFERLGGYPNYYTFYLPEFCTQLFNLEQSGFRTLNQEAYKINTYIWGGEPRWLAYAEHIIGEYHKNFTELYHTIKTTSNPDLVIRKLRSVKGVGMFLAHEYYQDICDARTYFNPKFAKVDKNMWTNVGPGASLGIRLIFPILKDDEQEQAIYLLRDLSEEYLAKKPGFKYYHWDATNRKHTVNPQKPNITLHNIEMWLCEYAKYWKMKLGVGKQRSTFKAKTKI